MADLSKIQKGDVVVFRNGDERKVRGVYMYDRGVFDVHFDRPIFGRVNTSSSWIYQRDGKYDRDDLSEWANDIVKIIKKDVDTQFAAE